MENFISDVKFRGFSFQGPIHHGKSLVISSAGPGLRPLPRVSTPYENPVQASIWQLSLCSQLYSIACWFCTDLSPVAMERKQVCA